MDTINEKGYPFTSFTQSHKKGLGFLSLNSQFNQQVKETIKFVALQKQPFHKLQQ